MFREVADIQTADMLNLPVPEAQKEFPQEEELAEKIARLGELNVLLDMDKKDQVLLDDGEGVEIEPEQKKKEHER